MDEKRAVTSTANNLVRRLHGEGGTAVAVVFLLLLLPLQAPSSSSSICLPSFPLLLFPSFLPLHLPILAQQAQEQQVQNQTEAAAKQAPQQVEEDRTEARRFDNKLHNK
jgi:hypothetical protein